MWGKKSVHLAADNDNRDLHNTIIYACLNETVTCGAGLAGCRAAGRQILIKSYYGFGGVRHVRFYTRLFQPHTECQKRRTKAPNNLSPSHPCKKQGARKNQITLSCALFDQDRRARGGNAFCGVQGAAWMVH